MCFWEHTLKFLVTLWVCLQTLNMWSLKISWNFWDLKNNSLSVPGKLIMSLLHVLTGLPNCLDNFYFSQENFQVFLLWLFLLILFCFCLCVSPHTAGEGLHHWVNIKELLQSRRHRFDLWVGKIPWSREWWNE